MTFLHPILFAAGLAAVAVPILIHLLLRQRRKPILWGAMRFLLEAYRRQRNRLRIEQWLLLATRCLLLALLAAALARPLLHGAGLLAGPAGRDVYVLIDNSIASALTPSGEAGPEASALERHKRRAADLLSSLGPADRAGLIFLGGPAQPIVVPPSPDAAAVRRLIEELTPTDSAADVAGGLTIVASSLDDSTSRARPATVVILSDFLLGSADLSRPLPPALAARSDLRVLASTPATPGRDDANVQVVSVEPHRPMVLAAVGGESPHHPEQVRVSLRRTGPSVSDSALTTVRLRFTRADRIDESSGFLAHTVIRWRPGQADAVASLQVVPPHADSDTLILTAEIDRDVLQADNVFRRPIGVRETLRAGIISRSRFSMDAPLDRMSAAQWLRLALRPTASTPIDPIDIDPGAIDAPTLASLDALFLPAPHLLKDEDWERVRRFAETGGLVLIAPPADASVHLWTDTMIRSLGLSWRIAREPREFDPPASLDDRATASTLLSMIAAELPGLTRPVNVMRALLVEDFGRETEAVLSLHDSTPWLIASPPGVITGDGVSDPRSLGLVVYLASAPALSWTDLPAKPLIVPLLQELVKQGLGRAAGSWTSVAGSHVATPPRAVSLRPLASRGGVDSAPASILAVGPGGLSVEPIRRAGLWQALDDAGRVRGVVAVNPDTSAARIAPNDPDAVRLWLAGAFGADASEQARPRIAWVDDAGAAPFLASNPAESPFSLPLLVAVLVLAAVELVMARYFSHAFTDGDRPIQEPREAVPT